MRSDTMRCDAMRCNLAQSPFPSFLLSVQKKTAAAFLHAWLFTCSFCFLILYNRFGERDFGPSPPFRRQEPNGPTCSATAAYAKGGRREGKHSIETEERSGRSSSLPQMLEAAGLLLEAQDLGSPLQALGGGAAAAAVALVSEFLVTLSVWRFFVYQWR